ncbi:MAG: type II toxin-antitoxin system PemK/MazF family toxin [Chloroflexi bacterium]|nr:MAG: type II toxin-antitoxin system PemK/MazF family toxin [Chloroflexota bacterium]
MARAGQIVLFRFPQTNLQQGKLRPALIVDKLPGSFDDCLICMISTQVHHQVTGFDDIIAANETDFANTGLKQTSLIRVGRLAVVDENMLIGSIGEIETSRLARIKANLANWLMSK